jgi:hypothetical protein
LRLLLLLWHMSFSKVSSGRAAWGSKNDWMLGAVERSAFLQRGLNSPSEVGFGSTGAFSRPAR